MAMHQKNQGNVPECLTCIVVMQVGLGGLNTGADQGFVSVIHRVQVAAIEGLVCNGRFSLRLPAIGWMRWPSGTKGEDLD